MNQAPQGGMGSTAKWIIGIIVIAVIVWGLMAANKNKNGSETTTKSEEKVQLPAVIKLGSIQSMTGDAAVYGEAFKKVMALAIDEINNSGSLGNSKIELVLEDGKCNGKDATSAAQKLVNVDKVAFILGGVCSSESLAAAPIAAAGKVTIGSNASTNPSLTGISPYFFRIPPSDNDQGTIDGQVATKQGYKKIAAISEQTDYAEGLVKVFGDEFSKSGGEIIVERYQQNALDFRTQLTKLKATNPDALFINTSGPEPAKKIIKQLKDLGWKPKVFLNESNSADTDFLNAEKDFLEGAFAVEYKIDQENGKFKNLAANYKQKYGADLQLANFSAGTYDLVYLFAEGVKAVGYDGEKLAAWTRTINNWQGATGLVTIKSDGDNSSTYIATVVKGGKLEPLPK